MNIRFYLRMKNIKILVVAFILSLFLSKYTLSILMIEHVLFSLLLLSLIVAIPIFAFLLMMLKEIHMTDVVFWGLTLIVCIFFHWSLRRPDIAFDTWQVYDMSRYIFDDFGYMSMIRQHIINTHYEMAFPPVFPFLMAVINVIADLGVMSAVFLNFLFSLLLIAVIKNIGDYSGHRIAFTIAFCAFVCTPQFRGVFQNGLTQLLGFTLFSVIMRLMIKDGFSEKDCFCSTVIAGIGLMNRFDFLAITGIIMVLTPFRVNALEGRKGQKIKNKDRVIWLFINVAIITIVCMPWISYSLARFGKIFVTDNGRRLINIQDTRPSTYFSAEEPALTISDDFGNWLIAFKERGRDAYRALRLLINDHYIFKDLALALLCVMTVMFICRSVKRGFCLREYIQSFVKRHFGVVILAVSVICQEITIISTGYGEQRYHIFSLFLFNVLILVSLKTVLIYGFQEIKEQERHQKLMMSAMAVILGIALVYDGRYLIRNDIPYIFSQGSTGQDTVSSVMILNEKERAIDSYLCEQNASCLVVDRNEKSINVPRTCSLIHTAAMISPSNISLDNTAAFVRDFNIDHIYSTDQELKDIFAAAVGLTETSVEHLYSIGKE